MSERITRTRSGRTSGPNTRKNANMPGVRDAMEHFASEQKDKIEGVRTRQEASANRSPREQIKRLDARLGIGVGAEKERAKLQAKIAAENTASVKPSKDPKVQSAEARIARDQRRNENMSIMTR